MRKWTPERLSRLFLGPEQMVCYAMCTWAGFILFSRWLEVTGPGGEKMVLQLAYFDRGCDPVVMDLGPVLDLEDAVGGKVCALASRVEPRDYADVAAALGRYSPAQLINFARRLDPGLTGEDFAYAGLELDQMDDRAFAAMGLSQHQVTTLREQFAAWPRDARTASQEAGPGSPAQQRPGHEPATQAERDDPEAEP